MAINIPPELTDLIIHSCVSASANGEIEGKATLLACSLVCRDWTPASRLHLFSRVVINCAPATLMKFTDLIAHPRCSFKEVVQEIEFVVPHERVSSSSEMSWLRPGFPVPMPMPEEILLESTIGAVSRTINPRRVIIRGSDQREESEEPIVSKLPLLKDNLRRTFTQTFSGPQHESLTSLTLSSILFETFSDLTNLICSFPNVTSLQLHELSFVIYNFSPHLPLQKLECLEIRKGPTISLMILWLLSFPEETMSPIRTLKLSSVSEPKEVFFLIKYIAATEGLLQVLEVDFEDNWELHGSGELTKATEQLQRPVENMPYILMSTKGGPVILPQGKDK